VARVKQSPNWRLVIDAPPIYWAGALGCYAAICGVSLSMGLGAVFETTEALRITTLLLPPALFTIVVGLWALRKPGRSFAGDIRVWLLTPIGLLGAYLYQRGESGGGWKFVLLVLVGILTAWGVLSSFDRTRTLLVTAEKQGWRISGEDEKQLNWLDLLKADMTPMEKLTFRVVITGIAIVIIVCSMILGALITGFGLGLPPVQRRLFWVNDGTWTVLAAALVCWAVYLVGLLRHQVLLKKQSQFELSAARQMQMSLMPEKAPDVEGLDIAGITVPALEVGGDLFHYYQPPGEQGSVGIAVADVSGKGMKAAVATVLVSGMLRADRDRGGAPAELLTAINGGLIGGTSVAGFVAMQALVVDGRTAQARYSNAGQVPPLLLRSGRARWLEEPGLPLGVDDKPGYEDHAIRLEPGDVLLLMTDGITEAMNEKKELLGFEGVGRAVQALPGHTEASAILESILAQVRAFTGKAKQHDDMTIVVVKVM